MKPILIALNILLAALAGMEVLKCINQANGTASAVAKSQKMEKTAPLPRKTPVSSPGMRVQSPAASEEQVNVIAALNIFSTDRTPNAPVAGSRATAANNARTDLTLVGTFEINDTKGAIILQRNQNRNRRGGMGRFGDFGFGDFGGFGGFGAMGGNAAGQNNANQMNAEEMAQNQLDEAQQRLAQLQSVMQTLQQSGATPEQLASVRQQVETMRAQVQQLQTAITATKATTEDGMLSISASDANAVRQYVKLGEITAGGYTLVDVTRNTATLRRNNEVIELTIQKPSDNQEAMAFAASRARTAQVVVSDSTADTFSNPAHSTNNRGRRNNGGFGGDFGGFGGGDFGGFGEGGGDGGFAMFGGGNNDFGGFGRGNDKGGFGGGNNGFGGGNGGFGGGNNNSRTNSMTGGNRTGMNSNSRTTMNSASSRNTTAPRNTTANRTGGNTAGRTTTNSNSIRTNTNAGRTNTTTSRNNAAGRTGVNTGNRTGGAGMGGR